ncbi:hypothetical protein K466DRAFT_607935 [Polyporus arcularius HHB13444]|uniref:Uncharacterized protein n=1 Tax=Polyporus arcularius HHB13444 TaxID=1314778 RepID=A0A5C3NKT2_9APHY|nr:hypothetical protein K466DRAFT_607935 [Polyporus arcularius HHB13444]
MLRHSLCLGDGRGTPARHAVVGAIVNRGISFDRHRVSRARPILSGRSNAALLQRTHLSNNGNSSFTLNATREFKVYIPRVPTIFDATDDLRLPSVMERLDFDNINDGDIVLVEVVLIREFV